MKKDYNKPLIIINEVSVKEKILALDVSSNPLNWGNGNESESGFKDFEW